MRWQSIRRRDVSTRRRHTSRTQRLHHSRTVVSLRQQLAESQELLRAIKYGDLDALVINGPVHEQIYTLDGMDQPYRTLVEAMNEGAVTLLPSGMVLYCNHRFAELVAMPLEQVIGAPFEQFVAPVNRTWYTTLLQTLSDGPCFGVCHLWRGDGQEIPTRLSLHGLPESGPGAICMVVTDLTEYSQAMEQLHTTLREREVLLKEIHHRVKNNLQVMASLLRLQARAISDQRLQEVFRESQHRIQAMALVHEQLYATESFARIDSVSYLRALASGIVRAYAPGDGRVQLHCTGDEPVPLALDLAVPLGLIVTELVSNSAKYAFPEAYPGTIQLDIHSQHDTLTVSVGDNGVGLPMQFDLNGAPSLGLQIVRSLTRQIRAILEVEHSPVDPGVLFRLSLPLTPLSAGGSPT